MNQVAFSFGRKHTALTFAQTRREAFRSDFALWLIDNWHVYEEFERRALKLFHAGRSHYGARSIWETMRYDSAVGELHGEWKLNDHRPPDLARLVMNMNPRLRGFFETRVSPTSGRVAA